jgi:hypothetical protein
MYSYVIQPDEVNAVSDNRKKYNLPGIILFSAMMVWGIVLAVRANLYHDHRSAGHAWRR